MKKVIKLVLSLFIVASLGACSKADFDKAEKAMNNLEEKVDDLEKKVNNVDKSTDDAKSEESEEKVEKKKIDLNSGLENIEQLANIGEDKLGEKLGDLYSQLSGLFSKATYDDIYKEYKKKIEDATPKLVKEYEEEASQHVGNIEAQAEICDEKVYVLAEISNEGVQKMASLFYKKGDYQEYEDWATKLYDVYMKNAEQITTKYLNTAG